MSKFEKAKERILEKPKDYTYTEAKYLLGKLGFEEYNKGKTSGSRVRFYRKTDNKVILLILKAKTLQLLRLSFIPR